MPGRKTYRNLFTSDETYDKVDSETKSLINEFILDFSTRSSPNSVKIYKSNFKIFFCWNYIYNDNTPFIEINKRQLKRFFIFGVEELKWGSARYKNVWSSLNTFSEWIENVCDDIYPNFRNNIKKIEKVPQCAVREKTVFTKAELDNLLNWLGEQGRTQEQCLLALIMASGMRIAECARMTTDLIDPDNSAYDGLFWETTKEIKTKGRGKHGKMLRKYIIVDLFKPYYDAWLPLRKKKLEESGYDHDYIFINSDGKPSTQSAFRWWMSDWDTALEGKHWYPHAGRHFWTSYLSKIGLEKQLIQELQGWSTDVLVDLYDDNTAKDREWKGLSKLREALDNEKNARDTQGGEK